MDTLRVCKPGPRDFRGGARPPGPGHRPSDPSPALTKMTMMTKAARYEVRAIHMLTKR